MCNVANNRVTCTFQRPLTTATTDDHELAIAQKTGGTTNMIWFVFRKLIFWLIVFSFFIFF